MEGGKGCAPEKHGEVWQRVAYARSRNADRKSRKMQLEMEVVTNQCKPSTLG